VTDRGRELFYLVVVGLLTAAGFASVFIARQGHVSSASLSYAAIFLAVFIGAHLVTRRWLPHADPFLLPTAALLAAIGLTEIYRIQPSYAFTQGVWVILGALLFGATVILLHGDHRVLESYKYLFGLGAVALLALPALPGIGRTVNGARLWVGIGGIQVQPGEFAKIALIVFLAGYLREKREVLAQGRPKDLGPLLVIWGAAMGVLVVTNDLGSALLLYGIFMAMLYVATSRAAFVAVGLVLFVAGAAVVYTQVAHVRERVIVWLHPFTTHPVYCPLNGKMVLRQDCQSFQLVRSLYTIADGGFFGPGFGRGTIYNLGAKPTVAGTIIPDLHTDFIYAALALELGLVGAAGLLLVYMVFALRGFRIALVTDDGFSKLLAAGLSFAFAFQTFIIVGGIVREIPLTGITLPFVSYGGSSVLANFVLLAGLLMVSNRANEVRA
jgi:cell division protein FtsW (lipid II flippase)